MRFGVPARLVCLSASINEHQHVHKLHMILINSRAASDVLVRVCAFRKTRHHSHDGRTADAITQLSQIKWRGLSVEQARATVSAYGIYLDRARAL